MNVVTDSPNPASLAVHGGPHWRLETLVEVAQWRAGHDGDSPAYTFLLDGETQAAELSYAGLDRRARKIAAELQRRGKPGQRVLVVLEPGLDYIASLFGCFYAGAIAVPVYPPDPFRLARTLPRLQAIFRNAECELLLSTKELLGGERSALRQMCPSGVIAMEDIPADAADHWRPVSTQGNDLALLQYTSGTTGTPRGVAISFANLQYNMRAMEQLLDVPDAVVMHWLPPYHDLGLIGGVFLPLFAGRKVVLMSPLDFMRSPARWLHAISRFRATTSASPNFGYEVCLRKVTEKDCEGLDLSCWQIAASGAEQVRSDTLDRFCEKFGPYGFRREAFVPAYGMAETTLMVSIGRVHSEPLEREYKAQALAESIVSPRNGKAEPIRRLVGCGPPGPEIDLRIVDPDSHCEVPGVGEIWVRCPGVAQGYWREPQETAKSFGASLAGGEGGFLRTGDLGFLDHGEVFVVGRRKETLILAGRNYYPQDIELAIQARDAAFKTDGGAVAAVEVDNEERLVILHEVQRPKRQNLDKLIQVAREAVVEETLHEPHAIVLLPVGELPKTSSGKTRRGECWSEYQSGVLTVLKAWTAGETQAGSGPAAADEPPATQTEKWLADCWADVLDCPGICRGDSFFALGGQSLQVVELLTRVVERTGKSVSVKQLFEHSTLEQFATLLDQTAATPKPASAVAKASSEFLEAAQPLTESQRRLWMLEQLGLPGGANVPLAMRLKGRFDTKALQDALRALAERHQALRTAFTFSNGQPAQRLTESADILIHQIDRPNDHSGADPLEWALNQEFVWRPFDLDAAPLVRAAVLRWSEEETIVLLVLHHLVCDGAAFEPIVQDLAGLYEGKVGDRPLLDYWDYLASDSVDSGAAVLQRYWRQRLQDLPPAINLPLADATPAQTPLEVEVYRVETTNTLASKIEKLAAQQGVTPFMVYLSAYQLLLGAFSGDERLVVGVAQAGRDDPAWRRTVGCFMNAVPVAADLSRGESFADYLARLRTEVLSDIDNARLPWDGIVEAAGLDRVKGRMPLAQAFFLYEDAPPAALRFGDAHLTQAATDYRGLGVYDLTLAVHSSDTGATLQFIHDPGRLPAALTVQMADAYTGLLARLADDPAVRVSDVSLASPKETARLVELGAGPNVPGAPELFLEAWKRSVAQFSESIAVQCAEEELSYAGLDSASDRCAQSLIAEGIVPGDLVGLMTHRSTGMLAAMLGVWKAGAAYVPLDPSYPASRLGGMIDDCRPAALVVDPELKSIVPTGVGSVLELPRLTADQHSKAELPQPAADRLAYVIYTSGSTGKPKGVMLPHAAVANFLRSFAKDLSITPDERVLAATTASFDISVLELFLPLTKGATVVMADSETVGDGGRLGRLIDESRVTLLQGTPSTYRMLLATGWNPRPTHRLLIGGEELTPDVARQLAGSAGRVWNVYGPTETTIWSTFDEITSVGERVSIGRPIDNTGCYLLDRHHRLAPQGVWGELAIGGDGLAAGYLNRAELTAERFPTLTLVGSPERVYLTGDRARWREDGKLEFGGRVDNQVKVRGHRIELGEVEIALCELDQIAEAAVITVDDALGTALAAYFVALDNDSPSPADLRAHLLTRLPEYMIPAAFVAMPDALPRNGSGKLDRARLPKAEGCRLARSTQCVPPRSPLEERLAEWWQEVLRVEEVGVFDNFFELGGHSLSVMQLTVRIRDNLGVEMPLREAYSRPTIAHWAEMILARQVEQETIPGGDALLDKLAGMSDDEAVAFLGSLNQ